MFAQRLFSVPYLRWILPLLAIAMLLQLVTVSPAAADFGATEFNTGTTVPVSNLVFRPPNPCDQAILLNGDFVIQAHIVTLPNSVFSQSSPAIPAGTIVTLHLDATQIGGIGLTDGTLYQGRMGTSQTFTSVPSSMIYYASFDLVPQNPNEVSPSPACPTQVAFQVQVYATELGFPAISASLYTPEENN